MLSLHLNFAVTKGLKIQMVLTVEFEHIIRWENKMISTEHFS